MRRFPVCACSTVHLPLAERNTIEALILAAHIHSGRIIIDHPILSIEPHQYGYWIHLGLLDDWPERPDTLSPEIWALLTHARKTGATWISFDRDEPPCDRFPVFPEETEIVAKESGDLAEPVATASPVAGTTVRCASCGSTDVMRDAWACWDDHAQDWVLGSVFDAAFCEACENDTTLVVEILETMEMAA
ncbi:hypothetical protein SLG_19320 [Sphingobium sp. SYK-6]|uniref:DUF5983 family protein n=1 Tax=Sphingobium sp. (strain NBRC 103272 / SYK-6) TaxID=627192 RepID=UPI00022774E0|nr:hypothetical protein [Sphingobium sp. SYK-6]BAK66607.1 hypothetical protein SLG_19320 [Sphingobium sp. SYK-6]